MNSAFVSISTLIKRNIGDKCLINFLTNVPSQSLRDYLECANRKGNSRKKKTNFIKMIVYGCITGKLNKKRNRRYINKTSKSDTKQKECNSKITTWIWKCSTKEKRS